jgi:VCBS repeat-containing protein
MTTSGTVIASIPSGVATGLTGNPNAPSTSTDATVNWNRATHLAFLEQPTDTVYGANINPAVTVQVLDANDAVVTESSAPIRLTLEPAGANLRGTNPVVAVNGVATFPDLTVDQVVGDFTLVAQAPGMTTAESAPFAMLLAPLTISAKDQTKPYGTTFTFSNTDITVSDGLVPGDTVDSLSLLSAGAPSIADVAGSPYPIVPFDAQGTGIANYDITYVDGSLTVTQATATIEVTGYVVPYDGAAHTATGTATGALAEDLSADLDVSGSTHTLAGSYPFDPWTFHDPAGNYADASGTVADSITPAGLTIMADDQTKVSGVDFVFSGTEFSATGLVSGDTVDSVTLTSAGVPAAAAPGAYPIDVSAAVGTGLANYTIGYVRGTMTVGNTAPTVHDAAVTSTATTPVSGIVAVDDPDAGQTVRLTISVAPAHGTAIVAQDGSFTYTPTGTYTGRDTFMIRGCDDATVPACDSGTVAITIDPVAVDDAAVTSHGETVEVDVQANDIGDAGTPQIVAGPAHGTATVGSIIYTPNPGFSGTDQVVYRICSPTDQTVCDDATLTVTVAAAPPTAPPTDAKSGLATLLDPERGSGTLLVGLATLAFVLTIGLLVALGRRRASLWKDFE